METLFPVKWKLPDSDKFSPDLLDHLKLAQESPHLRGDFEPDFVFLPDMPSFDLDPLAAVVVVSDEEVNFVSNSSGKVERDRLELPIGNLASGFPGFQDAGKSSFSAVHLAFLMDLGSAVALCLGLHPIRTRKSLAGGNRLTQRGARTRGGNGFVSQS